MRRMLTLVSLLLCLAACAVPALAQTPTAVEAHTNGSGQITIAWTAVAGATGYNVYFYPKSGTPINGTTPLTTTIYTVTGLTDTTPYSFVVTAIVNGTESNGTGTVARSGSAQVAAPTGLTAAASSGQVVLTWNAASNVYYDIYRQPLNPNNATSLYLGHLSLTATNGTVTYTDTAVTNGTAYTYAVAYFSGNGEGNVSGWVAATPLAPPSLTATVEATANQSGTEIDLGWTASAGAASYTLLRGTTSGGETTVQTGLTGTSFADTSLATNTTYYYEITAVAGSSNATSSEVSAKTGSTLLAAPTLSGTAIDGQVPLTWTAVTGASYYDLYRVPNPGTDATGFYTRITSGTSYTDTNVTDGTAYTYNVAAGSSIGQGTFSNSLTLTPLAAPTLTATPLSAGPVTLSWPSSLGATGYTVEKSTAGASGPWTVLVSPAAQSGSPQTYQDTGVVSGTNYWYRVHATAAGSDSGPGNTALAETMAGAPTGLTAVGKNGSVVLTWTAPSGNVGNYNVYKGFSAGNESLTVWAHGIVPTTWTDTSVTNGTKYFYKVAAVNLGGESAHSTEASATPVATPPAAPTLTATAGNGLVNLSWTAPAGPVTSYSLYRSTTSGQEGTTPIQTGLTGTSWTDVGLASGTTYYYTLQAVNGAGTGPQSSQASATPTNTGPAATTQAFVVEGDGHIILLWSAVSGASSYNLYRSVGGGAFSRIQSGITATTYFYGSDIVAYDNSVGDGVPVTYYVTAVASTEGAASFAIPAMANPAPSVPTFQYPSSDANSYEGVDVVFNLPNPFSNNGFPLVIVDLYRSTSQGTELSSAPIAPLQAQSAIATSPLTYRRGVWDATATQNIPYYYVAADVVASTTSGPISYYTEGPPSSEVSFTPNAATPQAPQNPALTYGNFSAALSWSAPAGGLGTGGYYNVYEVFTANSNHNQVPLVLGQTTGTTFSLQDITYDASAFPVGAVAYVTAVNGNGEGSTSSQLNINLPGFGLQPVPSAITIARGQHTSVTIDNPAANNFTGPVTMSVTGVPSGVTAWFDPVTPAVVLSDVFGSNTVIANNSEDSTLFLNVGSGVTPGIYTLTITGVAGAVTNYPSGLTQTVTVTLTVT